MIELLDGFLKEYIYYLKITKNLAKNTIISYQNDLTDYIQFMDKQYHITKPDRIEKHHALNYLNHLKRAELTARSIARKLSAIKSFHHYLVSEKLCDDNIILSISQPKVTNALPVVLNQDEILKLLDVAKGESKTLDIRI